MIAHLLQVALKANDLETSISFYRDVLGLPMLGRFDPPGIAFFDAKGVRLMLAAEAPSGQLYFAADHLEAECARLADLGVTFRGDPVMVHRDDAGLFGSTSVEEWMQFFDDPSGNLLAIAERRAI